MGMNLIDQIRWAARAAAAALAIAAVACPVALAQDSGAQVRAASAEASWSDLTTGGERSLAGMLAAIERDAGVLSGSGIPAMVESFRANLGERETMRTEKIAETEAELEEHLDKATELLEQDKPTASAAAFADALDNVLALEQLHEDGDAFVESDEVGRVIDLGERKAIEAEDRGDWLLAYEIYVRMNSLREIEEPYEQELIRIGRRLAMIRLYAPEQYWELRDRRRQLDDLDPLPPYNPTGDSYKDKFGGVEIQTALRAIEQAARRHLYRDRHGRADMIESGLTGVEVFLTTPELRETFPSLRDGDARDRMLAAIRDMKAEIAEKGEAVDLRDSFNVANTLMRRNDETVGVPPEAIVHEYGQGAMAVLDDYSSIIWPDGIERLQRTTEGNFTGVGIQIEEAEKTLDIRVVTPLEGTPAQRAGIRTGDIIRAVDGKSTIGFTLDQAVDVITGPAGTEVTLTIERPDLEDEEAESKTFDVKLTRAQIPLATVKGWERTGTSDDDWQWFIDPEAGIGYVRLTQFTQSTTRDFDKAIEAMREQGLNGLVFDLRFNPGGILDEAVNIVSRFVPAGRTVVRTVDAGERVLETKVTKSIPKRKRLTDIPVALLVNNGSASASEIVSGALQGHAKDGNADVIVVGQRTFGKGSVQSVFGISNQGPVGMKVTESHYIPFGGREIHRDPGDSVWGVEPDIEVEMLLDRVSESLRIRRDADIWPTDENGDLIESIERPDPDTLVTDGIDLQLQAALLAVRRAATAANPVRVGSIVP